MNTIILSQIPAHTNGFMGIGIGYWLVIISHGDEASANGH